MTTLSRSTFLVGSCAAALATIASPASAAWTAPEVLPGTAGHLPLVAALGGGGHASVGTYGPLALIPSTPQAPVAISGLLANVAAPAVALPDGLGSPVALSPHGTMIAVGGPRSPLDYFSVEGKRARLRVGIASPAAAMKRIPTHGIVATKTLASAVDDAGDAAVVFSRCVNKSCSTRSVLATFRRRGRGFGTPVVLAHRTGYPVAAVSLNARGDAIVAWIQHRATRSGNDIRVRTRLAGGKLTKLRIAGPTAPVPQIAVTLTNARHGTVAWFTEPVGEGSVGGTLAVLEKDVNARGELGALHLLDRGTPAGHGEADAVAGARLRSILGADGVTTYAWTGFANGHYVVRAERLDRGVGRVEHLSPASVDAQLAGLATDVSGDALAVWTTIISPPTTSVPVVGAVRRIGAATNFAAPEIVLGGADVSGTAAGAIAPGGRALVAGGPMVALNRRDAPGVTVTQLLG